MQPVVTTKALKIATPTKYTGDRKKLEPFILQCELYYRFNREQFHESSDKVLYAMYYLEGDASNWAQPFLKDFMENPDPDDQGDDTKWLFRSWDRFKNQIKQVFGDIDKERTAERELRRLKQNGSSADYAAKFQRIAANT